MHVALSVDRSSNKVHIYLDFVEEGTFDIPSSLRDESFDALDLNIGQDGAGDYSCHLPAQLDEMIILSDALSDSDIKALKEYYDN